MNNRQLSEMMIEADFLWREIAIGDQVVLECDLEEEGRRLITSGKQYLVLAKAESASGRQMLEVETDLPGRTLLVLPALICNYVRRPPMH